MAQYLGATVGQWVPGGYESLPDSVKVSILGIGNQLNGTPWTIAELEKYANATEEEQRNAGYLGRNPAQIAELLKRAKDIQGYYVNPQTNEVITDEALIGKKQVTSVKLSPGIIPGSGGDKMFGKEWGQVNVSPYSLDPSGKIVKTYTPTTGQESLEEQLRRAALSSSGPGNELGESGTMITRGLSISYDNMGNIIAAEGTLPDGTQGPISIDEAKKQWLAWAENPANIEKVNADRASLGQGAFVPGGLTGTTKPNTVIKTVVSKAKNADGSTTVTYSDNTTQNFNGDGPPIGTRSTATGVSTRGSGTPAQMAERQSAYDLLYSQFKQYGLEKLVEPLKGLIISGASPAEFTIKLRDTDAYKKRFAGNAARIQKGLAAISEAEYIGLEDQYQNIMRNYGLPSTYWQKDSMGTQEGFTNFIGNDVSATELEDRIMTAQQRVINANPEVLASLKQYYPGITNGDILAYTLDPSKGLTDIKRKITAAEIGGAATQAGLGITGTRAEELGAAGITKQQAQQGFQTVAEVAPRGGQLAAMYDETPYTQQTTEQEVFGLAGSTEAAKQRKKLTGLERASFSKQTGAAQGALGRERAGNL